MSVYWVCCMSCFIHYDCLCVNISHGKSDPAGVVSCDSSMVVVKL